MINGWSKTIYVQTSCRPSQVPVVTCSESIYGMKINNFDMKRNIRYVFILFLILDAASGNVKIH